jgi:hypothetical protein
MDPIVLNFSEQNIKFEDYKFSLELPEMINFTTKLNVTINTIISLLKVVKPSGEKKDLVLVFPMFYTNIKKDNFNHYQVVYRNGVDEHVCEKPIKECYDCQQRNLKHFITKLEAFEASKYQEFPKTKITDTMSEKNKTALKLLIDIKNCEMSSQSFAPNPKYPIPAMFLKLDNNNVLDMGKKMEVINLDTMDPKIRGNCIVRVHAKGINIKITSKSTSVANSQYKLYKDILFHPVEEQDDLGNLLPDYIKEMIKNQAEEVMEDPCDEPPRKKAAIVEQFLE